MEKICLCLVACSFFANFLKAQDMPVQSASLKGEMYFTLSADFLNALNINSVLEQASLPTLGTVAYGPSIGVNIYAGRTLVNMEGGIRVNNQKKGSGAATFFRYLPATVNLYYRLFNMTEATGLHLGCGYQFAAFNSDIFFKNSQTNLNSLNADDLKGALNLNAFSHGPEFSLMIHSQKRKSWWSNTNVKLSYALDISKPQWKSESANLTGSFSERFSRINISLIRVFRNFPQ